MQVGIEFVKHFRAHLSPIQQLLVNTTGSLLATLASDKAVKVCPNQ
jgi:peptidylprolyl isomerase domain and WD repeat-containing protein 1